MNIVVLPFLRFFPFVWALLCYIQMHMLKRTSYPHLQTGMATHKNMPNDFNFNDMNHAPSNSTQKIKLRGPETYRVTWVQFLGQPSRCVHAKTSKRPNQKKSREREENKLNSP